LNLISYFEIQQLLGSPKHVINIIIWIRDTGCYSVPVSQQEKNWFFSIKQASVRKDVKCVFDLLKKILNILAIPDRSYSQRTLGLIMCAYIILHNMIIDNEKDDSYNENYHTVTSVVATPVTYEAPTSLTIILQREAYLTSGLLFLNLQTDLIEHVWNRFH
jgi:hypothetical protein